MNRKEAIDKLKSLDSDDSFGSHLEADKILIDFLSSNGFEDVAKAYRDAEARTVFWYE